MRVLLDTNAYSALHRVGTPAPLAQAVNTADAVVLPVAVIGELYAGFAGGTRYDENVRLLDEFLAEPAVSVAAADHRTGMLFGRIEADLRRRGTPIPTNDIWIAAAAVQHGLRILTFDRHFELVPTVDVRRFAR